MAALMPLADTADLAGRIVSSRFRYNVNECTVWQRENVQEFYEGFRQVPIAMLLHDEELQGLPTRPPGAGLPLLNSQFAGLEVAGEERCLSFLICWGFRGGAARHERRSHASLTYRSLCRARRLSGGSIDSKAPLLNARLAIADNVAHGATPQNQRRIVSRAEKPIRCCEVRLQERIKCRRDSAPFRRTFKEISFARSDFQENSKIVVDIHYCVASKLA